MIDWADHHHVPSMLEAALEYALGGIALLPCHHPIEPSPPAGQPQAPGCSCQRRDCPAPAAHPLGTLAAADATAELGAVGSWWLDTPDANIATPAGLDVDVVEVCPPAAVDAVAAWLAANGIEPGPVLRAEDGRTRLLLPAGAGAADGDRVRVVADGELVLLPPSRLPDGRRVRWLAPPLYRLRLPDGAAVVRALAGLPAAGELAGAAARYVARGSR